MRCIDINIVNILEYACNNPYTVLKSLCHIIKLYIAY